MCATTRGSDRGMARCPYHPDTPVREASGPSGSSAMDALADLRREWSGSRDEPRLAMMLNDAKHVVREALGHASRLHVLVLRDRTVCLQIQGTDGSVRNALRFHGGGKATLDSVDHPEVSRDVLLPLHGLPGEIDAILDGPVGSRPVRI